MSLIGAHTRRPIFMLRIILIFHVFHSVSTTRDLETRADDPTLRPVLVDITENDLMGWTAKHHLGLSGRESPFTETAGTQLPNQSYNLSHIILWYNGPEWLPRDTLNYHTKSCYFNNCEHTDDRTLINQSSAVIFCITEPGLEETAPLQPSERPPGQVWIYFGLESPATQYNMYRGFIPLWKDSFNWSMSYVLDSDIIVPYGYLQTRQFIPQRDYSDIFRRKTKWALWLVSKCQVPSLRGKFVDKLKEHGFQVDIYGNCGEKLTANPKDLINNNYKFYLSFENSMCLDYVTEKFFRYFNYDTILVVRGGANYSKLLPKSTFIDTADFRSFKELVSYLKIIGNNETLYTNFLKRKEKYRAVGELEENNLSYCALCAKLNTPRTYSQTYEHIPRNLDTCFTPGDIEPLDIS